MADKSRLDSNVGSGTWDDWAKLKRDHLAAAKATEPWDRWFTFGPTAELVWACREDILLLDVIGDFYNEAVEKASAGSKEITRDFIKKLRTAYKEAINLVNGDTAIIQTIQESGLPVTLSALNLALLRKKAESTFAKLDAASKAVKTALANQKKAVEIEMLDVASLILAVALPELTITTKVIVGIGKWTVGKYLVGAPEQVEGDVETSMNGFSQVKKLRDYKAGLAHPAFQVLLDSSQVVAGDMTYQKAIQALRDAQKELEALVDMLDSCANTLVALKGNLRTIQTKCKWLRSDLRDTLDAALRAAGYSLEYFECN